MGGMYLPPFFCMKYLLLAAAIALAVPVVGHAQQEQQAAPTIGAPTPPPWPHAGDPWVDARLADINLYAERYPASFADEVSRYYNVPRAYVVAMLEQPGWSAGDIYMACALARVAGHPCRALVREWSRDHREGWLGVARRFDVEPGSAPYRRLRQGLTDSYQRWARPAPVDIPAR